MKIIEVNSPGTGKGTQVFVDGNLIKHATRVTLDIPADGALKLTIEYFESDENGRILLAGEGGDRRTVTGTLTFEGLEFEGVFRGGQNAEQTAGQISAEAGGDIG